MTDVRLFKAICNFRGNLPPPHKFHLRDTQAQFLIEMVDTKEQTGPLTIIILLNLFLFIILVDVLKVKARNDAPEIPESFMLADIGLCVYNYVDKTQCIGTLRNVRE